MNPALDNLPHLITSDCCIKEMMDRVGYDGNEFIPILHWEEIERVLEKAGYIIKFMKNLSDKVEYTCFFNVADKDILDRPFRGDAKSRQKAIMLSVIELGKEL